MTNLTKQEQTGRSMVEMLGTLAIIGVLSVAGVAGFNTAINKYKANEILNAASMRATVVSTQLQADSSATPSLGEFIDNTVGGATFNTSVSKQGTDKFVISFSTEPTDEVLKQMKAISGTSGIVRGYNGSSLVYNNDLTTEARTSDYNNNQSGCTSNLKKYCSGSKLCVETSVNCNTTCTGTISLCQKCDTDGKIVADEGNSCTTANQETGICNANAECVTKTKFYCSGGAVYDSTRTTLFDYCSCKTIGYFYADSWIEGCNFSSGTTYFCSGMTMNVYEVATGNIVKNCGGDGCQAATTTGTDYESLCFPELE